MLTGIQAPPTYPWLHLRPPSCRDACQWCHAHMQPAFRCTVTPTTQQSTASQPPPAMGTRTLHVDLLGTAAPPARLLRALLRSATARHTLRTHPPRVVARAGALRMLCGSVDRLQLRGSSCWCTRPREEVVEKGTPQHRGGPPHCLVYFNVCMPGA